MNEYETWEENEKKARIPKLHWLKILGYAGIVLAFFLARFLISLKLDSTWFNILGYSSVFWKSFFCAPVDSSGYLADWVSIMRVKYLFDL